MNAIDLLKREHETAKEMFARIRAASSEQRDKLWMHLKPELKIHEQKEETALYSPVAQEVGSDDQTLTEWNQHHHEEVAEAEALIQEISRLDAADQQWLEKVEELQEALEHHIKQEEGNIWPRIQQRWDEARLEQAGRQMESMTNQKAA